MMTSPPGPERVAQKLSDALWLRRALLCALLVAVPTSVGLGGCAQADGTAPAVESGRQLLEVETPDGGPDGSSSEAESAWEGEMRDRAFGRVSAADDPFTHLERLGPEHPASLHDAYARLAHEAEGRVAYVEYFEAETCNEVGCVTTVEPALTLAAPLSDSDERRRWLTSAEIIAEDTHFSRENLLLELATERSQRAAEGRSDTKELPVTVQLQELPFEHSVLRELSSASAEELRTSVIEERREQIAEFQKAVSREIERLGGRVTHQFWLTNSLGATMSPEAVESLLDHHLVHSIEPAFGDLSVGHDGHLRRTSVGVDWDPVVYDAGSGAPGAGRLRVGVIEYDMLIRANSPRHPAFRDSLSAVVDRVVPRRCKVWTTTGNAQCRTSGYAGEPADHTYATEALPLDAVNATHATKVASTLMAGILGGQDANIVDPVERSRRSSLAPESRLYFYQASDGSGNSDWNNTRLAVEQSVVDLVQVLNMSSGGTQCDDSANPGSMRGQLAAARQAGVVLISISHNYGVADGSGCTATFPATSPDVLSVGRVGNFLTPAGYRAAARHTSSGYGGFSIPGRGHARLVDIMAPGRTTFVPRAYLDTSQNPAVLARDYWPNTWGGTSYAAPVVSSAAALVEEELVNSGSSFAGNPAVIKARLAVMGDAMTPNGTTLTDTSRYTGFGRIRYTRSTTAYRGSPRFFARWAPSVSQGQTRQIALNSGNPLTASYTGIKAVVYTLGTQNFSAAARLSLVLVDTCPPGGGEVVLQTATERLGRVRVITPSGTSLAGRCVVARFHGVDVPSTVQAGFYAYGFSNARSEHVD